MKSLVRHPSFNWILGVIVAYCLLILSTTAEAAQVAKAEPVPGRDYITLHSEQGEICPLNSKRAVYFVSKTGENIEGCYVIRDQLVHLGFIDGDTGALSVEQFTWVPGNRPSMGNDKPGVDPGKDTDGTPRPRTPFIAQRGGAKTTKWM